jgi:hypothetical protein
MGSTAVVEQLREKIRKLEAQPRELVMGLRSGFPELDALGVFRLGSGVELCGEEASGRTTVALSVVAAAGREKRLSAWVDGPSELYPPAAMARGVDLQRLLIARPKSSGQLVWTAMQLLRSGVFVCVVLDVMHTGLRLTMTDAKKLLDAARTGGSLLVLLTSQSAPAQGFGRLMFSLSLRVRGVGRGEGPDLEPTPLTRRFAPPSPRGAGRGEHLRFKFETPHGKHAVLNGPRLRGRAILAPWKQPELLPVLALQSLQRPKKNVLRDGYPIGWMHPRESHHQVAPSLSARARGG